MEQRYSRNRIYVSQEEQESIKNFSILLAGSGIGSNIAECALRFGFENITIVDNDKVELSNLNRQNYTINDISSHKAEALYNRLISINPEANIKFYNEFITSENIEQIIPGHHIAINAIDFTSNIPMLFDKTCRKNKIPILHPYNVGWGGLVAVITPNGPALDILSRTENFDEIKMVEYVISYLKFWQRPYEWLEKVLRDYINENKTLPPPQLAVASWIVAGMCTNIMYNIATGRKIKHFPDFYICNALD